MSKFCKCVIPEANFDGTCKTCSRVLTWEQSKSSESEKIIESEPNSSGEEFIEQPTPWKPISKIPTLAEQILLGESATKRTLKYATLFENIGNGIFKKCMGQDSNLCMSFNRRFYKPLDLTTFLPIQKSLGLDSNQRPCLMRQHHGPLPRVIIRVTI